MSGQPSRPAPLVELEPDFEERWPGSNRLASACAINLWVLNNILQVNARQWARRGGYATVAAFNVLTVLHGATEPLLPSQIAERMMVTRATITGILDSLERDGSVVRVAHPDDGRAQLVKITPRARRKVARAMERLHVIERRFMEGLTPHEQTLFLRMLGSLQETVARVGAEP